MNEMENYLYNHAYVSNIKICNRQFELSKERAECIANKYNSLVEEKDKEIERLNNIIDELEEVSYLGMIENTANNDMSKGLNIAYEYINNKIQELRGNDNA